nr:MAG TPA: hemolysin [Caudoviricetes sp.]
METIIAAGISAGVTLLVCVINNRYQSKELISLITYRIGELEKKVDKHNSVVERTFRLEESTTLQEEKIKVINHRIEDLERKDD